MAKTFIQKHIEKRNKANPTLRKQFSRQFNTSNNKPKVKAPSYTPFGSGLARTAIKHERKRRYFGEGIF